MSDETCKWAGEYADCEIWYTSCGEVFILNGGTPEDNKMKFCPFCGKPLEWEYEDEKQS